MQSWSPYVAPLGFLVCLLWDLRAEAGTSVLRIPPRSGIETGQAKRTMSQWKSGTYLTCLQNGTASPTLGRPAPQDDFVES